MEMEAGKLFIGGISWDTTEVRLKEYFEAFGEVVEAVIMRDRTTGRARGFGFVVFADAYVAERVVRERHIIDGRTVEAKKAVPRDDHQTTFIKTNGSLHGGPPSPTRTKKIFVGGLPSTITETDFKNYFDQFGTITDVVVMYDLNTQRPRGFGFITYDSEDSVDRLLVRNFHELNGKMVEVKRAVPKELSPGSAKSPVSGYSYGLSRANGFLNPYSLGSNYGIRADGRFNPVSAGRGGYPPYSPGSHSMGLSPDSGLGLNGTEYSYFGGTPGRNGYLLSDHAKIHNYNTNSNDFLGFGTGNGRLDGGLGKLGEVWGRSPVYAKGRENIMYGGERDNFGGLAGYMRDGIDNGGSALLSPFANSNIREGLFEHSYGGDSFYSDNTWDSLSRELERSGPFGYESGDPAGDVGPNNSVDYVGDYSVGRSNRGIAA